MMKTRLTVDVGPIDKIDPAGSGFEDRVTVRFVTSESKGNCVEAELGDLRAGATEFRTPHEPILYATTARALGGSWFGRIAPA